MHRIHRVLLPATIAVAALTVGPGGARAVDEGYVPVVFELTLSGDVDSDDTFGVLHLCEPRCQTDFLHEVDYVCTGDAGFGAQYGLSQCEARTYRMTKQTKPGATVEYAIRFFDDEFRGHGEALLRDTVTIPEGGITLRLGYDYSSASVGPTTPPALPDTAAPLESNALPLGVALGASSLAVWGTLRPGCAAPGR